MTVKQLENVDEETTQKVIDIIGTETDAMYLDLSLFKKVGEDDAKSVHELNNSIKITIIVPEEFVKDGRVYKIVRIHDGEAEVIKGEYNAETREFTFETDRFSTYVLTYDKVINKPKVVMAGASLIFGSVCLLVVLGSGLKILASKKKR